MSLSRMKEQQKRIISDERHKKHYEKQIKEELKIPFWKRYEQDYIPGIDDGEPPAAYARAHPEEYDLNNLGDTDEY